MKITWKGKFDGNEDSLPHGEHKPNAVKFKEIDDIKKLGLMVGPCPVKSRSSASLEASLAQMR